MLPDIQPGNTKILYFFNCLLDGMHTILFTASVSLPAANQNYLEYHLYQEHIQDCSSRNTEQRILFPFM